MRDVRTLVRSSLLLGGASMVSVIGGLVRIKVAAVLLGPAGVGLIGVLQSFMVSVTTFVGLGLGPAATREIAQASGRGDQATISRVIRSLLMAVALAGAVAAVILLLGRQPMARWLLGDGEGPGTYVWIVLGIAAGLLSSAQIAILSGLSRSGSVARLQLFGAVAATLAAPLALWFWGERGIGAYVIASPLALALFGFLFVPRNREPRAKPVSSAGEDLRRLLGVGIPLMLGGFAGTLAQLAARLVVGDQLGTHALGLMQAGWLLPSIYLAIVLQVLQLDYYPALANRTDDPAALRSAIDQQSWVGLLMVGPPLLIGMTFSDQLIRLFFDAEFAPAATVLRWHIVADAIRFFCWPIAFLLLASGRSRVFMLLESAAAILLVTLLWLLVPRYGLEATGVAVLLQIVGYAAAVMWLGLRQVGPPWSRPTLLLFLVLLAALVLVAVTRSFGTAIHLACGSLLSLGAAWFSTTHLRRAGSLSSRKSSAAQDANRS